MVAYNPRIVMDGLVLCLDGANYKSFKGEATTNVVTNTNLDTGWSKTYNTNIQWNDYPPPDNVDSQVVSFVDSNGNGSGYWYSYGDYAPQSPSTTYTISVYARTIGSDWSIRAYTADNSETGRQWTNIVTVPGDGEWHRIVFNSITTPADTQSDSLSFNFTSIPAGQRCWLCAPQMEAKSYATTFTTGTRGTTVATGGGWKDLVGSNNGELVNGVKESDDGGGSLVFDGSNDYINGVHNTQTNITGNITIECWFRLTSTRSDWVRIFGKGDSTNRTVGLWYNQSSSSFLYQRYGSTNMSASYSSIVSLNTWYHMVGTSSGNSHTLYLNNVVRATSSSGTTFASSTDPYKIGYGNVHTYHIGNVSNCRIYNRALSAAEVKQNFNALRGRFGI